MENNDRKRGRKGLIKEMIGLGVTAFALLAALLFVFRGTRGFAWFSSNDTVNANGLGVNASGYYEIAVTPLPTVSPNSANDGDYIISASVGAYLEDPDEHDGHPFYRQPITSGTYDGIYCEMKSSSGGDEICPGTSGMLTFYIVGDPSVNIDFSVRLIGFKEDPADPGNELLIEPTDSSAADYQDDAELLQFTSGHFLFFSKDSTTGSYTVPIPLTFDSSTGQVSGSLSLTRSGSPVTIYGGTAYETSAYPFTIYWVWPSRIDQIIDSTAVGSVFGDETYARSLVGLHPEQFFRGSEDFSSALGVYVDENSSSSDRDAALETLKFGYNGADEFIGRHLTHIGLILNASLGAS